MPKHALRWRTEYTRDELRRALMAGTRCVRYEYAVSCLAFTLLFRSKVHLVRSADGIYGRGILYMLASVLLGPWALPWGPLATLHALWENYTGGHDVTDEIADWLDDDEVAE